MNKLGSFVRGDKELDPAKAKRREKAGKAFSFARDIFDKGTSLQFGSVAETVLDKIGVPESLGDVAGIWISVGSGNWPAVTEHVADLVKDIAAENGRDKLAGFCESYENVMGKVNKVTGKIVFMTAATIATGGAGAAVGASAGAVSLGGASMSVAHIFQAVSVLDGAIGIGEAWSKGDNMGAITGGLGVLGGVGGMGEAFGMSAESAAKLVAFAGKGEQAAGVLGAFGSGGTQGAGMELLTGGLLSGVYEQFGVSPGEDGALDAALGYAMQAITGSESSPESTALLARLLKEVGSALAHSDFKPHQMTPIKA